MGDLRGLFETLRAEPFTTRGGKVRFEDRCVHARRLTACRSEDRRAVVVETWAVFKDGWVALLVQEFSERGDEVLSADIEEPQPRCGEPLVCDGAGKGAKNWKLRGAKVTPGKIVPEGDSPYAWGVAQLRAFLARDREAIFLTPDEIAKLGSVTRRSDDTRAELTVDFALDDWDWFVGAPVAAQDLRRLEKALEKGDPAPLRGSPADRRAWKKLAEEAHRGMLEEQEKILAIPKKSPRREFRRDEGDEIWLASIERNGTDVERTFVALTPRGPKRQTSDEGGASDLGAALASYQKRVAEKLGNGWREIPAGTIARLLKNPPVAKEAGDPPPAPFEKLAQVLREIGCSTAKKGASAATLAAVEKALGVTLPADYAAFMKKSDGLEIPVGDGSEPAWLEKAKDVPSQTKGYRLPRGVVLIGSAGDGTGYAMELKKSRVRYGKVDLERPESLVCTYGFTFEQFVRSIRLGEREVKRPARS
ncbi:MAG TPA: SMI1/KNR4 family protein [Planctomycetota bacterium]|nr:SMI1/KNR4 family protein [Planctomycetota bacterium]